jgi:hypothetical protein
MYAWMARWLQGAPRDVARAERNFTPDPLPDTLVFHQRSLPKEAVTVEQLTSSWIDAARRQLSSAAGDTLHRALQHVLGIRYETQTMDTVLHTRRVILGAVDLELERLLTSSGYTVRTMNFTPFDADAAAKIRHFDTYNRTAASQRVADIVKQSRLYPGAHFVLQGDAALAGLLAHGVAPFYGVSVLDVGSFDTSRDESFVERLYIPGLRRAGDLQTAAANRGMAHVVIHNAGDRFQITGPRVEKRALTPREIVALIREKRR